MSSVCLCVVGEFANCICVLNTKGPVRASKWAFLLTVKRDTQKDKERTSTTNPRSEFRNENFYCEQAGKVSRNYQICRRGTG